MTPFQMRARELMEQREQASTPEGKAEAEQALAELIRENVNKGPAVDDFKRRQSGEKE